VKIPLASLGFTEPDIEAAIEVLRTGELTIGKKVAEFEMEMAKYLNVKHFIMVNSGSSANLAIIESLVRPSSGEPLLPIGSRVIVPAIAWPTTVWPIIQLGLEPVFVDIDQRTLGLDLTETRKILEKDRSIKALMIIHPLGLCLDGEELKQLCNDFELILLEDNCESLGSGFNGEMAGTLGTAGSFSFYFSHHLTTMEGGGVASNDFGLAQDLQSIRSHGWSRNRTDHKKWELENPEIDSRFMFVSAGFNIRPMEIQAAIGLSQLKRLPDNIRRRQEIARYIHNEIKDSNFELIGHEYLQSDEEISRHTWMLLSIRAIDSNFKELKSYMRLLENLEIDTRPPLTGNFTKQPALKKLLPAISSGGGNYSNADKISESTFLVGCHHDLTDAQVEFLGESLRKIQH
jgi:CDP-6-deoxy-D-xylo-4-hexulose-3-dehydrase